MIRAPFSAYDGDEPFVFVSYSHRDAEIVYPIIKDLHDQGVLIWFDEGISPGVRWSESLANAIDRCGVFLLFVTPQATGSTHCLNETEFALSKNKPFLAVHLEPTELPAGLQLGIGSHQAILKHRVEDEVFRAQLGATISSLLGTPLVNIPHGPLPYSSAGAQSPPNARRSWRTLFPAIALIALTVVATYTYFTFQDPSSVEVTKIGSIDSPDNVVVSGNKLAILSLYGGDSPYAQLASELSDSLVENLRNIGGLEVIGQNAPVGERVSAGWLLAFNVLAAEPDQPRVYVELIDVEKNARKHSYALDIDVNDVDADALPLWGVIARDVTELLSGQVSREVTEAWTSYFQGREQQRLPPSVKTLRQARYFFEQAISKDANFVRAYAGICEIGLAEIRMNENWDALESTHIEEPCEQALRLGADVWEARLAIGSLYRLSDQEENAINQFEAAQAIESDEPAIYAEWAKALAQIADPTAEQMFNKAIDKGNGFWGGYLDLANYYFDIGRLADARKVLTENKSLFPDLRLWLVTAGATNFLLDDWAEARSNFATLYQLDRGASEDHQGFGRSSWQSRVYLGTIDYYRGCFASAAGFQREAIMMLGDQATADTYSRFAEACTALSDTAGNTQAGETAIAALDRAISEEDVQQTLTDFRNDEWRNDEWRKYADAALYIATRHRCRLQPEQPQCELSHLIADKVIGAARAEATNSPEAFYFAALLYTQNAIDDAASRAVAAAARSGYSKKILVNDPILIEASTNLVDELKDEVREETNCPAKTVDPCIPLDIGSNRL